MRTQSTSTKVVEIDLATHRVIEAHRESFAETQADIIRRMLLNDVRPQLTGLEEVEIVEPRPWVNSVYGVTLPHGAPLRMFYKGQEHTGQIDDGAIVAGGQRFDNLSAAADAMTGVNLNGWQYWQVELEGNWVKLMSLRQRSR